PVELRMRNALETGSELITGQVIDGPVPVAELLRRVKAMPLPGPAGADLTEMPGGVSNTTHGEAVKRGVGYAVGFKNIGYSEGFDDYSTARVRLSVVDGRPRVEVHTAAAEVGQGVVTVQAQIAGTELGVNDVVVLTAYPDLDPETGQAEAHMQFAFAAHRAVVDVDSELGLLKVVELATAQDVGKAINPLAVQGQLEGGAAQGLGLAVMEEIQVKDGVIRNPSFTDYLLPTILDMPPERMDILELGDPNSPYGLKGVGEPPTISSGPAIVAAIRAATGRELAHVPVRPHDITL